MRQTLIPVSALLIGAAILLLGTGLHAVLLPVRAGLEGFSVLSIGFMGATHSVGFVLGCFVTPWMMRRVGHVRTLAVLSAVGAATALLYPLLLNDIAWVALRVATGLSIAGSTMIIESWLNEKASNTSRGVIFSIYMVVNLGAITIGTLLLGTADPMMFTLFAITAIAIVCSLIPTALSQVAAPAVPVSRIKLDLRRLYQISPVGFAGCLAVGLANGAFAAMGAIFGQRIGLTTPEIALFMAAAMLGGALGQFPFGRLSDRLDRRKVILGCTISATLLGIALVAAARLMPDLSPTTYIVAIGFYGLFIYPLYPLAVSHANDFISREEFVATSGGLLVVYGIGAAVGPAIGALVMREMGNGGLFAFTAAIYAAFTVFTLYRLRQRKAPAPSEKGSYVGIAKNATQAGLSFGLEQKNGSKPGLSETGRSETGTSTQQDGPNDQGSEKSINP